MSLIQSNYASVGFGSGGPRRRRRRVRPAESWRAVHAREGAPERARISQTPGAHTIIPAFMEKGNVRIAFGIMGGWNQAQAHAQFVSNLVDFNMNIQSARSTTRRVSRKKRIPRLRCQHREARIPEKTRNELHGNGAPTRLARRLLGHTHGFRSGGDARFQCRHELRRISGSTQRRRGGHGTAPSTVMEDGRWRMEDEKAAGPHLPSSIFHLPSQFHRQRLKSAAYPLAARSRHRRSGCARQSRACHLSTLSRMNSRSVLIQRPARDGFTCQITWSTHSSERRAMSSALA